jgi:hypothetical protein
VYCTDSTCCCVCCPTARPVVYCTDSTCCCVCSPAVHNWTSSGRAHGNSINRAHKATCPDKVVPRNNNKAKSSSGKGTIAPEDGQLLVTETCRVTQDTNILMF